MTPAVGVTTSTGNNPPTISAGLDYWIPTGTPFVLTATGIVLTLVSVDARVRDRFNEFVSGGDVVASWTDRASFLGDAVLTAARHQTIENAPMVVFATVGAVLASGRAIA